MSYSRKYRGAQRIAIHRRRLQCAMAEEDLVSKYWALNDLIKDQNFRAFPKLVKEAEVEQRSLRKEAMKRKDRTYWFLLFDLRK